MKYCNSLTQYSRFKTREVKVGDLVFGGNNPIHVQSMTTSDTMDTEATVSESIRMIEAGCKLVRITAPSKKEAHNLKNIKEELLKRGYTTPIVADIHYTPNAAEIAATIVEKVRINPGNYADKKKFEEIEYTDESYTDELDRIRKKFTPLVKICKEHGTAMRIGTNHGSLSDRILSRYGDTPKGMVESAMEFLRICRDEDYHEIILSMKASNTRVMVQAYRMLVAEMIQEGMNYPLHLGVTEAGEGEDGRIKSAVGIGTLLADGIGDTIRVSLTEAPEFEMPVAQQLLSHFNEVEGHEKIEEITENPLHSFDYVKRETTNVWNIGSNNVPVVMADFCLKEKITHASFFALGYNYSVPLDKWHLTDMAADYVFVGNHDVNFEVPGTLGVIYNYQKWKGHKKGYPFLTINDYLDEAEISETLNIVYICLSDLSEELYTKLKTDTTAVLMIDTYNDNGLAEQKKLFAELMINKVRTPVVIGRAYVDLSEEQLQLSASADFGALLLDGLGDGIFIAVENCGSYQSINSLAFGILQASRTRISKTEYISCPSCGRTLFDLQETTAKIRKETSHLKGLKIGIMGCIVNGPGEMADADYGYVGTGKGKITLYKEQTVVEKNISEEKAVTALINLIKEHGDWVEKIN
jgi:(E)-4-hydroxy-3-methylbut-2-enyl-diphosphate synthase